MTATTSLRSLAFLLLVAPHTQVAADEQALFEKLLGLTNEMRVQLDQATEKGLTTILKPDTLERNP